MQIKGQSGQFLQGTDGQGGAGDAVDGLVQFMFVCQADPGKLISKKGIADFPSTAFPESQYLYFIESIIINDQSDGDGFDLADLLQYPGSTTVLAPVTYA